VHDYIIIGKNGPARMASNRQVSMRNTPLIVMVFSLLVAAFAWTIPFTAPMVWSYWASAIGAPSSLAPSQFMENGGSGFSWVHRWPCGTSGLPLLSISPGAEQSVGRDNHPEIIAAT
jgi:hypothetical protein